MACISAREGADELDVLGIGFRRFLQDADGFCMLLEPTPIIRTNETQAWIPWIKLASAIDVLEYGIGIGDRPRFVGLGPQPRSRSGTHRKRETVVRVGIDLLGILLDELLERQDFRILYPGRQTVLTIGHAKPAAVDFLDLIEFIRVVLVRRLALNVETKVLRDRRNQLPEPLAVRGLLARGFGGEDTQAC